MVWQPWLWSMRAGVWPSFATLNSMSTEKRSVVLVSGAPPAKTTLTSRSVPHMTHLGSQGACCCLKNDITACANNLSKIWKLQLGESIEWHLQNSRWSVSVCYVINTLHVKANGLPGFSADRTQIRAGLFTLLMERLNRWRTEAFLTVCQEAQCNHLIFLVYPHFAGVIFGCWVSRSASTKCVKDCAAQLNRLRNPCQRIVSICLLSTPLRLR